MKLTETLKQQAEKSKNKKETGTATEKAGMPLADDDISQVAGGCGTVYAVMNDVICQECKKMMMANPNSGIDPAAVEQTGTDETGRISYYVCACGHAFSVYG